MAENKEKELKEMFDFFDKDKDGHITVEEMHEAMIKLGENYSLDDVKKIVKDIDLDENGTIEYQEFVNLMKHTNWGKMSDIEMRKIFDQFDKDKNGVIDASELKSVMKAMGNNPSDEDIQRMIEAADLDKNGVIDFSEFKKMMQN